MSNGIPPVPDDPTAHLSADSRPHGDELDGASPSPVAPNNKASVIVAHAHYAVPGGEDAVFESETALLREHGHDVIPFTFRNDTFASHHPLRLVRAAFWNGETAAALRRAICTTSARIVHVHNTFPFMSPSILHAAKAEGAAVVMTFHNFRLLCVQGSFSRNGAPCEKCLDHPFPFPAIRHACYRSSRAASAVAASAIGAHWIAGTWASVPDAYIALSADAKTTLSQCGLPRDRIFVKPNSVPPRNSTQTALENYAVYAGRLSPGKGIETLLTAWQNGGPKIPLYVVGDGPLAARVAEAARNNPLIKVIGYKSHADTIAIIEKSRLVVAPSTGRESCPMVVVEALACGVPVVASRLGSLIEMVPEHVGRLFAPGDPLALRTAVQEVLHLPEAEYDRMRRYAREAHALRYSPAANYEALHAIYDVALMRARSRQDRIIRRKA